MYLTHNLRANIQEWKNRLARASFGQFGAQMKYFLAKIEQEKLLAGMLAELSTKYQYNDDALQEIEQGLEQGDDLSFENDAQHAAFGYQFLKYLIKENGYESLNLLMMFHGSGNETQNNIIEQLITPFIYYLHDKLDNSNSTIYLLEKYKMRTEWFMKKKLSTLYYAATANYEQIFEDDLRLYLFDQGIDYPFSTPKSTSGRTDIVGEIHTDNPIVIEVKIVDKAKNYGKNRIKEGFAQIVKYTGDYNKDFGYLVIFNMDEAEISFEFPDANHRFPPVLSYNNKHFYFIVINCLETASASKIGKIETLSVTEGDLI
ncbi:hypothetical protein ACFS5N_05820 [Mucilaginibacter ximonensis]|uniref:PD-(D/E)XK nuclease superfamily protein n=1 Tax=Mucilaginibacter ximonensis TaxID=538021 RepID=A0ABW5Y9Q1_9SPHI